jgi:hypothetical protein
MPDRRYPERTRPASVIESLPLFSKRSGPGLPEREKSFLMFGGVHARIGEARTIGASDDGYG